MFRSTTFSILFGIPIGTVGWGDPCRVPPGALPDAPWVLPDVPETLPDAPGRARSGQEAHNSSKIAMMVFCKAPVGHTDFCVLFGALLGNTFGPEAYGTAIC